jgi:hypothetical protein
VSKHGKNSNLRPVEARRTVAIQLPLRMLDVLQGTQSAFFGLCVEAGRQVLSAWMEEDREALCGPKGRHQPERSALRSGSTPSEITLGGRRIPMRRPRARTVDGQELSLASFQFAAGRDPLDAHTLAAVAAGVASRRYASTLDPLPPGEKDRSTSKSSVSRRFVALTQSQMAQWLSEPLGDRQVRVVMIDGKVFADHAVLIALGIADNGEKIVLGMREGTTENAAVAKELLRDIIERGVSAEQRILFVIDGGKGIRKAVRACFGSTPGSSAAPCISCATCSSTYRSLCVRASPEHCARPGAGRTPSWPASNWSGSQTRSIPTIPARRVRCARVCPRP